jgi:hypothetical protein
LPFVEGYFKAKHATQRLALEQTTQYFEPDDIGPIVAGLEALADLAIKLAPAAEPLIEPSN